jgi:hypothetical protein
MLQKPNISKPKKKTKRNLKSKTPPEVSKLLNTIGLDSSSSFISSRSSSSSKNKSSFSSESSNSNSGNQAKGSSPNVTCISSSYNESLQMSPIEKTKSDKRIRKNYKFIRTFESLTEMDTYVRSATKNSYKINKNNGPVKCSICPYNSDKHLMEQQYWICLCGVKCCELAWKVNKCCNNKTWYFAQSGELHPNNWVYVRAPGEKPKKRYGIALNVQEIYTSWLKKDETLTALDLR